MKKLENNIKEHIFEKKKFAVFTKFSADILNDIDVKIFEDKITNTITARMEAFFYEKQVAEKEIVYYFDRPTFLDWLLRRRKTKRIKINISDVLNNPPKTLENTIRHYTLTKQNRYD